MKRIRKIIGIFILIAIVVVSVNHVSFILENKDSENRYYSFFKEEQDFDVLFLGSSHVRHGFFPMELWNDYGITSYNLAANGSTIPVSYWTLVNALDHKTPKIVVMDVFDIWPRVISSNSGQVHGQIDAFPLSVNKIKMINDLYDRDNLTEETMESEAYKLYDRKYVLLWPFSEYHTRWNSLEKEDFITKSELEKVSSTWKGSAPLYGVVVRQEREYSDDTSGLVYDDLAEKYLLQMIDLCKQKNIELLLINTGIDCSDNSKYFADSAKIIAEKNGLPYLDFTQMDLIDFGSDLNSTVENTHVNFSGAEKYTSYIGDYLATHYSLVDHRDDSNYSKWESDYRLFEESKVDYLVKSKTLTEYLLFLTDDRYQAVIEVEDEAFLEDEMTKNQLRNLGIDIDHLDSDTEMIVVDCKEKNGDCYSGVKNSTFDTVLGSMGVYVSPGAAEYGIYLNEKELKVQETGEEHALRITVIDRNDGSIIDIRDFSEEP